MENPQKYFLTLIILYISHCTNAYTQPYLTDKTHLCDTCQILVYDNTVYDVYDTVCDNSFICLFNNISKQKEIINTDTIFYVWYFARENRAPEYLCRFTNIKELIYYSYNIKKPLDSCILGMPNLVKLEINAGYNKTSFPFFISKLPKLTNLYLIRPNIYYGRKKEFRNLKNIKTLSISLNQRKPIGFRRKYFGLTNINTLDIDFLFRIHVPSFNKYTHLKDLKLTNFNYKAVPYVIKNCDSLRELQVQDLRAKRINYSVIKKMSKNYSLKDIRLILDAKTNYNSEKESEIIEFFRDKGINLVFDRTP